LCYEFSICRDTVKRKIHKLRLQKRKIYTTEYDKEEFIKGWHEGISIAKLAVKYGMSESAVSWKVKSLGLPPRQHVSSCNENDFREAHAQGLSSIELAEKFKISRCHVYHLQRKMGLPYNTKGKNKTIVVEPLMSPPEPVRSNKTAHEQVIEPQVKAPVIAEPIIKVPDQKSFFIVPTLKQVQRERQQQDMKKAERNYKIKYK
jgi:hypothetical protein